MGSAQPDRPLRRLFAGLTEGAEPRVTFFPNDERYQAMVMEKDLPFYSLCSHHFVPFYGHAHIAYIPNDKIVGLSKIGRILEFYARRPQLQERLTEQVERLGHSPDLCGKRLSLDLLDTRQVVGVDQGAQGDQEERARNDEFSHEMKPRKVNHPG